MSFFRTKIGVIIIKVKTFFNLVNLKRLSLYRNLLETLPDEISKCRQLQYINLGANPIKFLPETMKLLEGLKHINLRNCKLTKIPEVLNRTNWISLNTEKNFLNISNVN